MTCVDGRVTVAAQHTLALSMLLPLVHLFDLTRRMYKNTHYNNVCSTCMYSTRVRAHHRGEEQSNQRKTRRARSLAGGDYRQSNQSRWCVSGTVSCAVAGSAPNHIGGALNGSSTMLPSPSDCADSPRCRALIWERLRSMTSRYLRTHARTHGLKSN